MTEHEKFFWICDEIGYKFPIRYSIDNIWIYEELDIDVSNISFIKYKRYINVREIIFTPDFWNKFIKYCAKVNLNKKIKYNDLLEELFENNLHDPVTYLYNLLFNK